MEKNQRKCVPVLVCLLLVSIVCNVGLVLWVLASETHNALKLSESNRCSVNATIASESMTKWLV